jgi:hypothetical protein
MEVHHHPNVEKKRFREYILEFLMIFLAVTMGFFAESLRENISNKDKEKEYINSFVQNLKEDTTSIGIVLRENELKTEKLIRFMSFSFKDIGDPETRKLCFKNSAYIGYYSVFKSNDATMQQLKNSGDLRLIKKSHVADSIAFYDNQVKIIYEAERFYSNTTDEAIKAAHAVFDYSLYYDSSYFKNDSLTGKLIPLVTNDPQKIKLLFSTVDYEIGANKNYIQNIRGRLPFINRFIVYLQKEYHLENE